MGVNKSLSPDPPIVYGVLEFIKTFSGTDVEGKEVLVREEQDLQNERIIYKKKKILL